MAALRGAVARRYARALFQLGVDKGSFEALGRQLEDLASLYGQSQELRQALENPIFKLEQKQAVLGALLPRVAPSPEVRNFALLLLERRRMVVLPGIARAFRDMVDERLGRVRAEVVSARPLDVVAQGEVQRAIEQRLGKKVIMKSEVDPTLLGGVIARVGGLVLDGSLRSRLEGLRSRLLN